MSLIGAVKSKSIDSVNVLLHDCDKFERDNEGMMAIHWAAQLGYTKIFRTLMECGISPFTLDASGFSPYYYARRFDKKEILQLLDEISKAKFFTPNLTLGPLPDPVNRGSTSGFVSRCLTLSDEIDKALLDCGLHSYAVPIGPIQGKEPASIITALLYQILHIADDASVSSVGTQGVAVNPHFISEFVSGVVEEFAPLDFLKLIVKTYDKLGYTQKLLCVSLVKELILQDTDNEWIASKEFSIALKWFIHNGYKTKATKTCLLFENLSEIYAVKKKFKFSITEDTTPRLNDLVMLDFSSDLALQLSKGKGRKNLARMLAQDLTIAFTDAILSLTPRAFFAVNLFGDVVDNPGWRKVSHITTHLTEKICLDVLSAPSALMSALIFQFYLDVIKQCLNEENAHDGVCNLGAAFAIFNGLQFNVITRLTEMNAAIPTSYLDKLANYQRLFSSAGGFASLLKLTLQTPGCIPSMPIFSGDKEKMQENSLVDRLFRQSKLNHQIYHHRLFMASRPSRVYRTDIMSRLDSTAYDEDKAYKLSYVLCSPQTIDLDKQVTFAGMIIQLKDALSLKAPLVVMVNKKERRQKEAKKEIVQFLGSHNPALNTDQDIADQIELILTLCDRVMDSFEQLGEPKIPIKKPAAKKRKKVHDDKSDIVELTQQFSEKMVITKSSEAKSTDDLQGESKSTVRRKRAHTVVSGTDIDVDEKKERLLSMSPTFLPSASLQGSGGRQKSEDALRQESSSSSEKKRVKEIPKKK